MSTSTFKQDFERFRDEVLEMLYVVELGRAKGFQDEAIFKILAEESLHSMSDDEVRAMASALVIILSDAIKAARQLEAA